MKKLVYPGLTGSVFTFCALVATFLTVSGSSLSAQNCIMACPPMDPPVVVSVSSACQDVLTYDLLGVVLVDCPGEITVDILENGVSIGDVITIGMAGNTYMVNITHPATQQSCMMTMMVVDQQAPIVTCPPDVTLECTADLDEYTGLAPQDIFDCSPPTNIFIDDVLVAYGNCPGNIISQYERTYIVVDAFGNATTCEQLISLEKVNLIDVAFPPNIEGPDALSCFPLPDTSPDQTGYPTVNGNDIVNGVFCNLTASYLDNIVPLCSGSYKIIRTWTVIDWCDNNQDTTATQIIEVLDLTPPVVQAPADMTISTGPSDCTASIIAAPAIITEDCSDSWTVRIQGPFGTIHSNGGALPPLPVGNHNIIYKATNDCGLEGVDTLHILVQDLQPPVPVCHQFVAIPVNNVGTATIPATVFNGGSYDNCGNVYFKVKRMSPPGGYSCANPGNPNNLFDDFIQFCCEDIDHNNIMVILRVYDVPPVPGPVGDNYLQGQYNDCMIEVEVQDKLPPQIICPSNLTVSCQFPYALSNLDVFGSIALAEEDRELICIDDPGVPGDPGLLCIGLDGLATDNCNVDIVESPPIITINNCGIGTLIRTFTATDDGGLQSNCQQVITFINYDPFDEGDIAWPPDYTTFNICEIDLLDPDDLPAPFNAPAFQQEACDLVAVAYEDDVFDFSNTDQACFKILRTWTVIDWCQINTPAGGIWTHLQVIKVMNNVAPVIEPIADLNECSFDLNCEGITIDFEAQASDDCSGPASLSWRYFIDINNDQSFDFTSPVILGESIQFSRPMPIGTHRIVYTVWDRCGNTTTEEQFVSVESCTPPSAKCIHGLSTNLMPMDIDGDGTPDWGMVTIQASMFDAGSDHPCGNPISLAFSSNPLDVSRVFDCGDIGINEIEVWVIDDNGLADFCVTEIDIQDNNGVCPPIGGGTGIISGSVVVPQAGTLAGAMIYLDGSPLEGSLTGQNGYFVFPSMPLGGNYIVRPVRNSDVRNGVTALDLVKIQKHLLGMETFSTPFQYIAADANNSASITAIDIIQLRKLILGIYDEFPNNTSWRFVDKAHIFPDPHNPWLTPWPETYTIQPFSSSMNDVDFNAVKIGDLNLTAHLSAGGGIILPRGDQRCQLEYEVVPQPEEGLYRVDLYLQQARNFNAIQFSFTWDQTGYEMVDWNPGELISRDDIRMPAGQGDNGSLAAFALDGWKGEKDLLISLWVRSLSQGAYPFQLFLQQAPTPPVAYRISDEEALAIQLSKSNSSEGDIHNRPNPFSDMTTISFRSLRDETATLRIYDPAGKMVYTRPVSLAKGDNAFVVTKSELRTPGIYMYEVESNFQYRTNRMIIVD